MSKKLVTSYTFTASAKTVDSADFTSLEKIQLITNVTSNVIIYNFADAAKGGALSGTTLTLDYDTTAMSNTDKLQVFVEDATQVQPVSAASLPLPSGAATAANQATLNAIVQAEDAAHASGDMGTMALGVRNDAQTVLTSTDGDYSPVATDGAGNRMVVGNVTSGATDSGNPVKVGGKYNSTQPTYTTGQRGDLQVDSRGNVRVTLQGNNGTSGPAVGNPGDGLAAAAGLYATALPHYYNGTTYDRARSSGPTGTAAVAGSFTEQAGLSAAALSADLVASTDVSAYKWLSIHVAGTFNGTVSFQGSNDNTNWVSVILYRTTSTPQAGFTGITGTGSAVNDLMAGPVQFRYFRARMTAYTSGTATGVAEFYTAPTVISANNPSTQSGTWTVGSNSATGSAVPANAFLTGVQSAASTLIPMRSAASAGSNNGGDNELAAVHYGQYLTSPPTVTTGNFNPVQIDVNGNQKVTSGSATGSAVPATAFYMGINNGGNLDNPATVANSGDAQGTTSSARLFRVWAEGALYNGTNFDRRRGNEEATLLASAARTTTQTGADITNYNGQSALIVVLDVTSAGTGSVTLSIEGKDTASGKYYTILAGTAVTTNSTNRYRVSPTLASVANSVAQDHLPRIFRITVTANNANSVTYSVGYNLTR